jgi:AcrR family transcriptional regulator
MPNFTKQAIKDTFIKLLNERPLSQITVKDIVAECGINRNSFYYHFSDLPALIEEILQERADRLVQDFPTIDNIEDCFYAAFRMVLENKRSIYHIYNSVNRDLFERYLMKSCVHVVTTYFDTAFAGQSIDPKDRGFLIRYYACSCFGTILDWLGRGLDEEDAREYIHRICQLNHGLLEETVRRSQTERA